MRRAEISGKLSPFSVVDLPIPEPSATGVVIKTHYAGVCHSDVHLHEGYLEMGGGEKLDLINSRGMTYPIILGHEISGEVYSLGKEVSNGLRIGQRVMVYPWVGCANCPVCKGGDSSLCKDRSGLSLGQGKPGGYSTFVPVPDAKFAVPVPDGVPMDIACMAPCSGITAYNGLMRVKSKVENMIKLKGKANLLIVGTGGLGLWCIQLAKIVMPATVRVTVADISEEKLKVALEAGADDTLVWGLKEDDETLAKRTQDKFGADGLDAAVDFVNNTQTSTRILNVMNVDGILSAVGLFGGMLKRPLPTITGKAHTITGTIVGPLYQLEELAVILSNNQIKNVPITHYKLEEVEEVVDRLRNGKVTGRAILKFEN